MNFSHLTVSLDSKPYHLFSEIMLNEIPVVSRKSEAIYNPYKVSFQAEKKGTAEELKFALIPQRFLSQYPSTSIRAIQIKSFLSYS